MNRFYRIIESIFTKRTRKLFTKNRIVQCKVVSHRGEDPKLANIENTILAFDKMRDSGIWGIEFDVRWTQDLQPVVIHDKDFRRLFNSKKAVNDLTLSEIKEKFPLVPSLEEVIRRYGKKLHLMIEIKDLMSGGQTNAGEDNYLQ